MQCAICRTSTHVSVYDEEGDILFTLSPDFSDSQIKTVVEIADDYFGKGIEVGKASKQKEIRAVLGL